MTKYWKKFTTEIKFYIFLIKNCNLLIPRPPKRTSKLLEKSSSLKREHLAALQNLNIPHFCGSFWPSWIRIRSPNADPDPADQMNADPDRNIGFSVIVQRVCVSLLRMLTTVFRKLICIYFALRDPDPVAMKFPRTFYLGVNFIVAF
jgi:hypothetical protein